MSGGWRVGADIGGTFTDIVALGPNQELRRMKVSSTVEDYGRGICEGLAAGLDAVPARWSGPRRHAWRPSRAATYRATGLAPGIS